MLGGQGLDDIEVRYLPANLHNRPERIVPGVARGDRRGRQRARRCSSPTPTAARAAPSTRSSPSTPGSSGSLAPTATSSSPERALRRPPRRRARHVLPHRLPRQALRRARLAGARPRPPPALLPIVLRQLPPARAAVAARRPRRLRGRHAPRPIGSGSSSTTSTPASHRSPPPSPSASPARVA